MMKTKILLTALLLFLVVGNSLRAQETTDFGYPPEPNATYKVTVKVSPEGVATASGTGRYKENDRVTINTSVIDSDYQFKYWQVYWKESDVTHEDRISTTRSFTYTVEKYDVTMVAFYELIPFNPVPTEPNAEYKRRVYFISDPEEACSFSIDNGTKFLEGASVTVAAIPNQNFIFNGWFDEKGILLVDALKFTFEMPTADVHYTARFTYSPGTPDEPSSSQTTVDRGILGDLNGDGVVDATDVAMIVNFFLAGEDYNALYDINKDSKVDVTDVTAIVNIYLDKK